MPFFHVNFLPSAGNMSEFFRHDRSDLSPRFILIIKTEDWGPSLSIDTNLTLLRALEPEVMDAPPMAVTTDPP